jgi:hypothetical protein
MFGICWISLEGFPPDIHRRKSAEVLMLGFETIVRPVGWESELSGCMECLAGEDSIVSAGEAGEIPKNDSSSTTVLWRNSGLG